MNRWKRLAAGLLAAVCLLLTGCSTLPDDVDAAGKKAYIRLHPGKYTKQLTALAESNPEALDFVYYYPEKKELTPAIDLTAEAESGELPLLMQWDERWGYRTYGSGIIGLNGCGPTCLSMVAIYLTGNAEATPLAAAKYAEENGYYAQGNGTKWTLMSEGCAGFGLEAEELPLSEKRMADALGEGRPIILIMGPGDFTSTGHYIVLTGYADSAFTVNDPNSRANSEKTWAYDDISGQIRNIWAFSVSSGE